MNPGDEQGRCLAEESCTTVLQTAGSKTICADNRAVAPENREAQQARRRGKNLGEEHHSINFARSGLSENARFLETIGPLTDASRDVASPLHERLPGFQTFLEAHDDGGCLRDSHSAKFGSVDMQTFPFWRSRYRGFAIFRAAGDRTIVANLNFTDSSLAIVIMWFAPPGLVRKRGNL